MVVDIQSMIQLMDDFVHGDKKTAIFGSIDGTEIERFALDTATSVYDFNQVLIIQGCQDYIGITKKSYPNYIFYGDLLLPEYIDPVTPINPWVPKIFNPAPDLTGRLDINRLASYKMIVILNAHLIPPYIAKKIDEGFNGQIMYIIDAVEEDRWIYGMDFANIPVLTDTLLKVPPIVALARYCLGVETKSVNGKSKGVVNEINKLPRRSIGKIDDKQYVSEDYDLISEVHKKQLDSPFRKNQKVMVRDNIADVMIDDSDRRTTIIRDMLLHIHNSTSRPLMRLRIHNSKQIIAMNPVYNKNILLRDSSEVAVQPANILRLWDTMYHRFNHIVYIENGIALTKQQKYCLLKNANNLTVVHKA